MNMEVKPGYQQTEVGVIPDEWKIVQLNELADIVRGGSPRPAGDPRYFNGNFIPWLTVASLTNISENTVYVSETTKCLTELGSLYSRTLPGGTLAIVNSGAKTLGVSKIIAIKCCANDGIAALLSQSSGNKEFMCYYLNSQIHRIRSVVAAGNDQLNLNTSRIGTIAIPFPNIDEQEAIAGALGDADGLIESLEQLVAKKRQIKHGAMQELLTGQKRLPGFTGQWEVKRLGDVGTFLKGSGVTKSQAMSGELRCVRYGELYTRHNEFIKEFFSFISAEVASTAIPLQRGDILFAGSGETKEEIGKCAALIDDVEAYAGGDIVILRTEGADALFLGYYLNTPCIARQKASRGQGDAVVHISSSALATVQTKLPKLDEQAAIAAVLLDMDAELAELEAKLAKARQVKAGMMQELLTGRIRLV